jgi:hypothetical protein
MRHQLGEDGTARKRGRQGSDCGSMRFARRRSASLPAVRRRSAAGRSVRRTALPLAAGRRQQAPPGGVREVGEGIGWRDGGRAGAPQLHWTALLAERAATRPCRAATGRSHIWPPRSSPTEFLLARGSFVCACEDSKVVPNLPASLRPYPGRKRAVVRRGWDTRQTTEMHRGPERIWQNPSIPRQQG